MKAEHVRVLLIEDDEDDYFLLKSVLQDVQSTSYELEWVQTFDAALKALELAQHDIFIVDYRLGKDDGLELLRQMEKRACKIPAIILTGQGSYDVDIDAMRAGAADYLVKARVSAPLLEHSIRYAIERKRTEVRLCQLNRTLKVLSKGIKATIHIRDEFRLLQKICELLVETGGYRLAWIGFAEQDEKKSVRPVAQAGFTENYLESVEITWENTETGRGPTGRAIRTGKAQIAKDLQNDPDYAPWRAEAIKRGYASSVAIPLVGDRGVFGALNIYSVELNNFDEEEMRLLADLAGSLTYGIKSLRTSLEHKRAECYYRSLLASMHEDIFVIDREYRIRDVNTDYVESLGRKREDLIGCYCHEVSHGYRKPCSLYGEHCALQEVFETGQPVALRHRHTDPGGAELWMDMLFSPLRDENGHITHVIKAGRNVTHEVELESQLRQAQKMEAIGTLAGGISHDFNNILGIILGYAELAILDTPKESPRYANLQEVRKACHRCKDLINQILAFSRKGDQQRIPLHIGSIMKEALKLLRSTIPSTIEIRQKIDISPGSDIVLADSTQIHQVFMNLCTNASHAMKENGGILEVGLSTTDLNHTNLIKYPGLKAGSYVHLTFADTGHGMDGKTVERIFEPYFTTKAMGEGTGLGLAVAHGIVKNHGGAISVHSEPGTGTVFDVFLPALTKEVTYKHKEYRPLATGTESILLVDDEKRLIDSCSQMLERLGYTVVSGTSSIEMLETFRAQPDKFDLVVTDQTMPQMTGLQLAEQLLRIRPILPIILCTGFSENVTAQKAKEIGVRELLMKPFSTEDLARLIRCIMDK